MLAGTRTRRATTGVGGSTGEGEGDPGTIGAAGGLAGPGPNGGSGDKICAVRAGTWRGLAQREVSKAVRLPRARNRIRTAKRCRDMATSVSNYHRAFSSLAPGLSPRIAQESSRCTLGEALQSL